MKHASLAIWGRALGGAGWPRRGPRRARAVGRWARRLGLSLGLWAGGAAAAGGLGAAPLPTPAGFVPLSAEWDRVEARHPDGSVLELERLALRRAAAPHSGWAAVEAGRLLRRLGAGALVEPEGERALGEALQLRFSAVAPEGRGRGSAELRVWPAGAHSLRARILRPGALAAEENRHWDAVLAALEPADLPAAPTPPVAGPAPASCAAPEGFSPLYFGEEAILSELLAEHPAPGAPCAWAAQRAAAGGVALLRWCALDLALPDLSDPAGLALAGARLQAATGATGWTVSPDAEGLVGRAGAAARPLGAQPAGAAAVGVEAWSLRDARALDPAPPPRLRCPPHRPAGLDRLRARPGLPLIGLGLGALGCAAAALSWALRRPA